MNEKIYEINRVLSKPLLKRNGIVIKQSMAGRMRVKIKTMVRHKETASWMQQFLSGKNGITHVKTNTVSGSVIVLFNADRLTAKSILGFILAQVLDPVKYTAETEPLENGTGPCPSCNTPPRTFNIRLRRVLMLSGIMAYALIRSWIFKLALAQNLFSLLGAATVAGTVPLVKEAIQDTAEKKKVTVKPFLAAGSIITILMGEAFSALQIIWIYNVAETTEAYVAQKSRQAIRDILEVAPANAYVMRDGMEVETPVAAIRPGDMVAAHTGEKIPVDGVITDGDALVDEASINGRSEAIHKHIGDTVYAGTIISQGTLFIRTVKTGEDTYLSGIMKMVEDSLANKAPAEQKADQLASRLMKIGFAATLATFALTLDPLRALTVMLVMSCPCATVLAASSAVTAALANAAKHSVLIKGGRYLETIGKTEVFCFDKTGTLTLDLPQIISITGRTPSITEDAIISMAATAESHNQHPMARAILLEAQKRELVPEAHAVCEFKAGRGVLCTVGCDTVLLVGSRQYMEENDVDLKWFNKKAALERSKGRTVVFVAKNGSAMGMMGVANPVRPEAVRVLNNLKKDGVNAIHLVTGDNKDVARTMMAVFPFDDCRAPLLPEEKAERIKALRQAHSVVMVGDGVNDALALAQADIGVAIGAGGAEVAIEAADIALADANLEGLVKVRNLSHQAMKIIDQNHYFAVSTDLIGAVLGMAGILSPVMAGLIHIVHTGGILVNSGRLLSWEPPATPMTACKHHTPPSKKESLDCESGCKSTVVLN